MKFLIRFSQSHENFRRAELDALAELQNTRLEILEYREDSPFCIARLQSCKHAQAVVSRALLVKAIYELWASADDYDELHERVKASTSHRWSLYKNCSFKYMVDTFRGSRTSAEQVAIVNSFSYLGFDGQIKMKKADQEFCVFEEYTHRPQELKRVHFGRLIGEGARHDATMFSLKKRRYISTTSMDAELALIGSNLALSRPGSLFYDPFAGTGGLTIACSHHGAVTLGSDLDGRTLRGKKSNNVYTSYSQYGLQTRYLDGFVSDLTHNPLRLKELPCHRPFLDGIVCDPPYGVREGLKVLGTTEDGDKTVRYLSDGSFAHLADDYIPQKRAYSFEAMLADILEFAAQALIENGRLSFWMPVANDDDVELGIPMHSALELVSNCLQPFNRWSRRLLTYRRRIQGDITESPTTRAAVDQKKGTADELNSFRRRYFQGFKSAAELDDVTEGLSQG